MYEIYNINEKKEAMKRVLGHQGERVLEEEGEFATFLLSSKGTDSQIPQ
jgi:hypothetical protein